MPYLKYPRPPLTIDLNPMMDMVFLLITFFLLAAKFKPAEPAVIDPPVSSTRDVDVPGGPYQKVYFDKHGRVFVGFKEIPLQELSAWVGEHPQKVAGIWIKGDRNAGFPVFEAILKSFTANKIHQFILETEAN